MFCPLSLVADKSTRLNLRQNKIKLEGNGPIDERATVAEVSVANFKFIFEISNLNKEVVMRMVDNQSTTAHRPTFCWGCFG